MKKGGKIKMNKRLTDIENAFAASLSFGFEKEADYSLEREDEVIEKRAGINIYQPTVDNIELFVRKYLLNELAFFPKTLSIDIKLTPSSFNAGKNEYVKDAQGLATTKLHDAVIEFPFLIIDGELIPFDVIQMNKQRIPYSRENLRKVLFGIDKTFNSKQQGEVEGFEPFVKVDELTNPTTSPGFLGNVLQIQDQHIRRRGNDVYITASELADDAIEKLATSRPLSDEDYEKLRMVVESKLTEDYLSTMHKVASEVEAADTSAVEGLFAKIQDIRFEDASRLPNGTIITFPEKKDNEITMTKGIVISNYMDIGGIQTPSTKIVISNDGRMKVLTNKERFLCFKSDDAKFHIPMVGLASVQRNDVIVAFDGTKAFYPSIVDHINDRSYGSGYAKNDVTIKIYNLSLK
jgi:hypothetical protein